MVRVTLSTLFITILSHDPTVRLPLLRLCFAVSQLSGIFGDERLQWLAQRARPFHCTVGQELLRPDRMPEYCFCIVEGRGRLLHDDPGLRRPSPWLIPSPAIWLVGRDWYAVIPCEWLTAATPLKLIGFSADDFYTLESESESFSRWLASSNSPAELMAVLAPSLRARVVADPPEREVLRKLLPGLQVIAAAMISARFQKMMPFGFGILSRFRAILYLWVNLWIQSVSPLFRLVILSDCYASTVKLWTQCLETDVDNAC